MSRDSLRVEMEATLSKFETQMRQAVKSGTLTATQLEQRFARTNSIIAANANRAATAQARVTRESTALFNVSRGGRFVLQNTAAQFGDIAVQMQMGTDTMRVMGQQMPQILGGFGVLGGALGVVAPLLGVVAAIGFPIAGAMMAMGEGSEDAAKGLAKIEGLSLEQTRSSIEGLKTLQEQYTDAVRDHARYQTEATAQNVANLGRELQARTALLDLARVETENNLRAAQQRVTQLRADLQGILDAVRREAEATTISVVGDPDAQRRRNEMIAQSILAALDAQQELVGSIRQAEAETTLLELAVDSVRTALDDARATGLDLANIDFSGNISAAADEAARLAQNLSAARAQEASNLAAQYEQYGEGRQAAEQLIRESDPLYGGTLGRVLPKAKTSSRGGSRGRSGGSQRTEQPFFGQIDADIQQMERQMSLIGRTRSEVAALTAKWALLDEAKRRNLDVDAIQKDTGETLIQQIERQSQALGRLTEDYETAREQAQFYDTQQQAVRDGMLDAILEGENLVGTLANVAKAFARASLEAYLFGSGPFAGSGGGGLLTPIVNAVLGKRALGGPGRAGQPYIINENTPRSEVFVPSMSGGVLNQSQAKSALRDASGGGTVVLEQHLHFSLGVTQTVQAELTRLLPTITRASQAGVEDAQRRRVRGAS